VGLRERGPVDYLGRIEKAGEAGSGFAGEPYSPGPGVLSCTRVEGARQRAYMLRDPQLNECTCGGIGRLHCCRHLRAPPQLRTDLSRKRAAEPMRMLGLRVSVAPMLLSTSYTGPGAVDTGVPSRAEVPNLTIGLFCLSMMAVPCASYCKRTRESGTEASVVSHQLLQPETRDWLLSEHAESQYAQHLGQASPLHCEDPWR
jgi:hypothetical protein